MKKVFKFDYQVNCGYGNGMLLVTADSEDEARQIAEQSATEFGTWVFSHAIPSLTFDGPSGRLEQVTFEY